MKRIFLSALLALTLLGPTTLLAQTPSNAGTLNGEPVTTEPCVFGLFTCVADETVIVDGEERKIQPGTVLADPALRESVLREEIGGGTPTGTGDPKEGLAGYILRIGYFINIVLIPFLFAIALLVFLVNIVRYFLLSNNIDKREDAKRAALYGILAFVFLVSIWGIVNLFVTGFGFDDQESVCPDYLGNWCNNRSIGTAPAPSAPVTSSYSGGISTGSASLDKREDSVYSALAELVFGDYQDQASFGFSGSSPAAANSVIHIPAGTSCTAGISMLQTAADTENQQAAYLFYMDADSRPIWKNVTDATSRDSIRYHKPTIQAAKDAGGTGMILFHTQSDKRVFEAGLNSIAGSVPSVADYRIGCSDSDLKHVTVDWANVWQTSYASNACSRINSNESDAYFTETLYNLAQVTLRRNQVFDDMMNSNTLSGSQKDMFRAYENTDFDNMSTNAVTGLANFATDAIGVDITKSSAAAVCR